MLYKIKFRKDKNDWVRTGYGVMKDLLPVMKQYEIIDMELADDEPMPAKKDLTDLIDLALATHDEAWFMELVGRKNA